MATKIGRFKIRDNQLRKCADSSEEEFMNELHGTDDEPQERPEQTALREFKKASREKWGPRSDRAYPKRSRITDTNLTPTQRFKQASRILRGSL